MRQSVSGMWMRENEGRASYQVLGNGVCLKLWFDANGLGDLPHAVRSEVDEH